MTQINKDRYLKKTGTKDQRNFTMLYTTPGIPIFAWKILNRLNNDPAYYTDFELFTAYFIYYFRDIDRTELQREMLLCMKRFYDAAKKEPDREKRLFKYCFDYGNIFKEAISELHVKRVVTNPDYTFDCIKVVNLAIEMFNSIKIVV